MSNHCTITNSSKKLVKRLQERIRRVEVSSRNDDGTIISSGSTALDNILPSGGYNRGTIIQWAAESGSSAEFLSLIAVKNAAKDGGAIVVIDPYNQFYPPAGRALGINLSNLIVLRTGVSKSNSLASPNPEVSACSSSISNPTFRNPNSKDFLWSIEQSLRCNSVAAVWGELPEFNNQQTAKRWQRRFQLSAESSGCCGMFIRCLSRLGASHGKTDAGFEIQWHLQPLQNKNEFGNSRFIRASLIRCRGGAAGKTVDLEINTITGNVQEAARSENETGPYRAAYSLPLATQLANPKTRRHAARA